ncbi:NAD-dependent epimerase/dehydratase family protein [Arthrobacter sp. H5]|uniref:NAD-dependent epimerase/dehydratase family protein n=1 Tax=Arthrobacter sp. H5 TaxID=1267973 RepID=UPI0004B3BA0A
MTKPLAVTGSTGYVGGAVAHALANDGYDLTLPVRDVGRAPQLKGARAAEFSYSDSVPR